MNTTVVTIFMIALLVLGLFLTIAVLLQHGKSHGLGTITGAAENFLGKEKGTRVDRLLARMTTILGILFVLIVLLIYIFQPTYQYSDKHQSLWQSMGVSEYYGNQTQSWVKDSTATEDKKDEGTAAPTTGATAAPTESATTAPTEEASAAN